MDIYLMVLYLNVTVRTKIFDFQLNSALQKYTVVVFHQTICL